jgi:hypothetical protein
VITTVPVHEGPRAAWIDRAIAAVVLGAAVVCTVVLWRLDPDPKGYDTHTQLGMTSCSWPQAYGMPCPTCGATTAACLVVHGRLLSALVTQPFGAAVATAGLLAGAAAGWCLLRGRSFLDVWMQLPRARLLVGAIALLLLAWGYKWLTFEGA